MDKVIRYKAGYKYQLAEDVSVQTAILLAEGGDISRKFYSLSDRGMLLIRAGYAWDGPSGPSLDTPSFMFGSLVHDVLYQMMGDGDLSTGDWRRYADDLLADICALNGMPMWRRNYVWLAVRTFGGSIAEAADTTLTAPAEGSC
jgi:hypothetical protein